MYNVMYSIHLYTVLYMHILDISYHTSHKDKVAELRPPLKIFWPCFPGEYENIIYNESSKKKVQGILRKKIDSRINPIHFIAKCMNQKVKCHKYKNLYLFCSPDQGGVRLTS